MVSEAVIGALVGGGAAVAGSYVQAYFGRKNAKDQIDAQNRRREAEMYLSHKAEALKEAFEALHKATDTALQQHLIVSVASGDENISTPIERDELFDMANLVIDYREKLTVASIYLDDDQQETLLEAGNALMLLFGYILSKSTNESFVVDFYNSFDIGWSMDGIETNGFDEVDINAFKSTMNNAKLTLKDEMNKPIEDFEYSD